MVSSIMCPRLRRRHRWLNDAQAVADALSAAVAAPRDAAAVESARLRFGRAGQTQAVLNVYRSISVCRTFGTLMRDYAPGSESYR